MPSHHTTKRETKAKKGIRGGANSSPASTGTNAANLAEPATATRYIPATEWNQYHSWPPIGGLRHIIFHAETNGFKSAIKRSGRRVLINEAEFFRCLERMN